MLSKEAAKRMFSNLLGIISDFSDREYQKRAWIKGEPPGTDFDETVCQFADIGDPILEHYQDFDISESQYQILKNFRDAFRMFSDNNNWPPKFIDTPAWNEIIEMAKEVLKAFNYDERGTKY